MLEGQVAKVEVGREFVYPSPTQPETFKSEMTGISQYVRARSFGDRKGVKLDVVAQAREFLGFNEASKEILVPVIQTRRLQGTDRIKNGHSLVLEGLVTERSQEVEDSLLFFSKKRSEKIRTELIVIVTTERIRG